MKGLLILIWAIYIIAFIISLIKFPGSIYNLYDAFIAGLFVMFLSIIILLLEEKPNDKQK